MDEALEKNTEKVLARMENFSEGMANLTSSTTDEEKEDIAYRKQMYDPTILINYALKEWSYPVDMNNPSEQLDGLTRDWLWQTIVEANTRPPALSLDGEQG